MDKSDASAKVEEVQRLLAEALVYASLPPEVRRGLELIRQRRARNEAAGITLQRSADTQINTGAPPRARRQQEFAQCSDDDQRVALDFLRLAGNGDPVMLTIYETLLQKRSWSRGS